MALASASCGSGFDHRFAASLRWPSNERCSAGCVFEDAHEGVCCVVRGGVSSSATTSFCEDGLSMAVEDGADRCAFFGSEAREELHHAVVSCRHAAEALVVLVLTKASFSLGRSRCRDLACASCELLGALVTSEVDQLLLASWIC